MIVGEGFVGVIIFFLWVFCIVDAITAEQTLVRNLPKVPWVLIVIFFPLIGSILWLILGRPANARFVPGSTERRAPAPRGFEDSAEYRTAAEERRLRQWQEDLQRREEELRRKEQGDNP